ncbi:hypothetical protein CEXT_478051 [Caerostris extrusa]|uniref:Uncharacterized protein n=1 Tax=Caerostris extrusa TaxID=172846 RepID=A0AAV4TLS8_CAEEX|nr:hypothetical protein CEXT_478051 [Caerostris extrusa]
MISSQCKRTTTESGLEDYQFFHINSFDDGLSQHWVNDMNQRHQDSFRSFQALFWLKTSQITLRFQYSFPRELDKKKNGQNFFFFSEEENETKSCRLTSQGIRSKFQLHQRKRKTEKGQTELVYRGKRNSGDYVRLYRSLCVCPLSSGYFSVPANTHDSLCATVRTDEKESGTAYWDVAPARLDPRGVTHQKISCDHRSRSRMGFSEKTND